MTQGACLCGAVRFEFEPPYRWFAHCHCSMCRKHHGALFGTGLGVDRDRFRWLHGTSAIVHFRASPAFERPFCRHCGAKVPGVSHLADVMLVPAGTLDRDLELKPRAHIFVESRSPLAPISDSLPQFAAYPPGVDLPVVDRPALKTEHGVVTGSCLCGEVAYTIGGGLKRLVHCHCSLCRRSRGGPYSTTAFTSAEHFAWSRGTDVVASYRLPPPRTYGADFCAQCGSIVPTVVPNFDMALIPAGALDTPLPPLPGVHIHVGSKADWDEITDTQPQFEEMPPADKFAEYFA